MFNYQSLEPNSLNWNSSSQSGYGYRRKVLADVRDEPMQLEQWDKGRWLLEEVWLMTNFPVSEHWWELRGPLNFDHQTGCRRIERKTEWGGVWRFGVLVVRSYPFVCRWFMMLMSFAITACPLYERMSDRQGFVLDSLVRKKNCWQNLLQHIVSKLMALQRR